MWMRHVFQCPRLLCQWTPFGARAGAASEADRHGKRRGSAVGLNEHGGGGQLDADLLLPCSLYPHVPPKLRARVPLTPPYFPLYRFPKFPYPLLPCSFYPHVPPKLRARVPLPPTLLPASPLSKIVSSFEGRMTGFEIAGLVLAVVPLLLEGLKAYPKTSFYKTSEAFIHAKKERREFVARLSLLHSALRFAMIDIFRRINYVLTPDQRRVLIGVDSVGAKFFDVWKEVSEKNHAVIEKAFEHTLDHIEIVLESMVESLSEMVRHTGISSHDGREVLRDIIRCHANDSTSSFKPALRSRFKFAKADSRRRELLEEIGDNIKLLKRLNKGQELIAEFVAVGNTIESQCSYDPLLDAVHHSSTNLYHALSKFWQCDCHRSPIAMLKLENRATSASQMTGTQLRFSLVLTFEHSEQMWGYQDTEVCINHK
jgi:hypothetical protein